MGARAQQSTRLNDGWEFLRSDLGSVWEAVRPVSPGDPGSVPVWKPVHLPHCVNARDGVDPDVSYYQGPAWYRTQLDVRNTYAGGHTLLHFEGAGVSTDVYVYTTKVGSHVGGYDEWTVDITNAVAVFEKDTAAFRRFRGLVPVSIRCDNSRDVQRIPSSLSDFTVYGGIYRYLDLEYVPAVWIDNVLVNAVLEPSLREARVRIRTLLSQAIGERVRVRLTDPSGKLVKVAEGDTTLLVREPQVWSVDHPMLYTLEVTTKDFTKRVKFGFRNYEFRDHGPFFLNGQRLLIRGTHRHEDHAGLGAAMTEDLMRAEMIQMKEGENGDDPCGRRELGY